jgi:hypothetical protein
MYVFFDDGLVLVWIKGWLHAEIKLQFNFAGGDRGLAGTAVTCAFPLHIE